MKNKIALYGGKKIFPKKKNHFNWPPKYDRKKIKIINKYLKYDKLNNNGYPLIVEKFEKTFAKLVGTKYALSTNSGTSALHSAYFALGLKKNDEVIVPSLTFHATGTPLLKFTKNIKFCGCDEVGNINVYDLKKNVSKKTKLVVITHLGGHPCDMDDNVVKKKIWV